MKARITLVKSVSRDAELQPVICFIPGGPGLSSDTLRSMDILSRSFDLAYVDLPGTGGLERVASPTFENVAESVEEELSGLNRRLVLCGHSFGALLAAEIASKKRLSICALVAIAAPFSKQAYTVACRQYETFMTPRLTAAQEHWKSESNAESLADYLAAYGVLYFSPSTVDRGVEMLRRDRVSPETFRNLLPVLSAPEIGYDLASTMRASRIPKYMLAGELDLMLPPDALVAEASDLGCVFRLVLGAGHFITFDQPEAVAGIIEEYFLTEKE